MSPVTSHARLRDEFHGDPGADYAPAAAASVSVCSLCGARYSRAVAVCAACPLHAGCDLGRCPHCGFSSPARSRWADWIRRVCGIPMEERP